MILLSLCLILLFLAVASTSGGVRDAGFYSAAAARLREKRGYHHNMTHRNQSRERAGGVLNMGILNQLQDSCYYGTVRIGTPYWLFKFWIVGDACQNCGSTLPHFNSSNFTSFKTAGEEITLDYLADETIGQVATDNVTMGGFTINRQTFLDDRISGVMGLAPGRATGTLGIPFWHALASVDSLLRRKWALVNPATDNEPGGVFTLGGTDSSLFQGPIDFVDIQTPPGLSDILWQLSMTAVTVQGKRVEITSGKSALSVISTGMALIGGPMKDVRAIWNAVPGSRQIGDMPGFWAFPCKTSVSISFSFGGRLWPINPVDMNLGRLSDLNPRLCIGAIFDISIGTSTLSQPEEEGWVIGSAFLKNVYTVFRMTPRPSIGFARLSAAASSPVQTTLSLEAEVEGRSGLQRQTTASYTIRPLKHDPIGSEPAGSWEESDIGFLWILLRLVDYAMTWIHASQVLVILNRLVLELQVDPVTERLLNAGNKELAKGENVSERPGHWLAEKAGDTWKLVNPFLLPQPITLASAYTKPFQSRPGTIFNTSNSPPGVVMSMIYENSHPSWPNILGWKAVVE
ncbi:aspartic peptidase domain-containing protein [Infundibulicybe gibba]|nr:aspartic peptidase domain-containing protein [Infundibulicybe gibba]